MSLSAIADFAEARPVKAPPRSDYDHVRKAVEFISETWREQPSLERVAAAVGLPPLSLQRLFTRWAGLSPKAFVQALTIDHARSLLADSASVLDASYEVGLSGPGRLHDLFVTHEAMTPGAYNDRGLAGLAFADPGGERAALDDMKRRWPRATYIEDLTATAPVARRIFDPATWRPDRPLRIVMIGSDFELRVWETLLKLPLGKATTYSDIASHIGKPAAARAVGTAIGRNPISFVVPCHRVLGKGGSFCGYHWGVTRKRAILGWEAGVVGGLD